MANIPLLLKRKTERWEKATFKAASLRTARTVAKRLVEPKAKAVYLKLQGLTDVPWFAIAMIHEREASQRWDRSLAQGDPWNRASTHVPKGRGPFNSFIEAGVDALVKCAPYASKWKDWSPGGMLTLQELYNGLGYANRNRPSAYIWSGSNQYVSGKYVADGVYDPNTVDPQLGCAVMLKAMMELDDSIYAPEPEVADESADDGDEADPASYPGPASPVSVDAAPPPVINVAPEVVIPKPAASDAIPSKAPASSEVQGEPELFSVQTRLKAMNYNPGVVNGAWGGMMSGALAGFFNDRHIALPVPTSIEMFNAVREQLKLELGRAESENWKRPVSQERASGDKEVVAQVAPEVVPVKQNYFMAKWSAFIAIVSAGWTAVSDKVVAAWNFFTDHKDNIPTDPGMFKTALGYVGKVPASVWLLLGGFGLAFIAFNSLRAVNQIKETVKTGARQ